MARKKTTITHADYGKKVAELHEKASTKKSSATITCDIIDGLTLEINRTPSGTVSATWWLRYTSPVTGARDRFRIGRYSDTLMPGQAADKAKDVLAVVRGGVDPNLQIKDTIKAEKETHSEHLTLSSITLQGLMEGPWTDFAKNQYTDEGKASLTILGARSGFGDRLNTPLSSINEAWLHKWQGDRIKDNYAQATIKRAYDQLKSTFNILSERGDIPTNPLVGVGLKELTAKQNTVIARSSEVKRAEALLKRRPLRDDEVVALGVGYERYLESLVATNQWHGRGMYWFQPYYAIGFESGARPGDIDRLQWGVHIDAHLNRLVFTPSKTSHHTDPIQVDQIISGDLRRVLLQWYIDSGKPKPGSWVFPSIKGSKTGHIHKDSHVKPFNRCVVLGGLPAGSLQFYALRHNFISQMLIAGVPQSTVAELAGHKTTKMIDQNYRHLTRAAAGLALDILAKQRLGKIPTTDAIDSHRLN